MDFYLHTMYKQRGAGRPTTEAPNLTLHADTPEELREARFDVIHSALDLYLKGSRNPIEVIDPVEIEVMLDPDITSFSVSAMAKILSQLDKIVVNKDGLVMDPYYDEDAYRWKFGVAYYNLYDYGEPDLIEFAGSLGCTVYGYQRELIWSEKDARLLSERVHPAFGTTDSDLNFIHLFTHFDENYPARAEISSTARS